MTPSRQPIGNRLPALGGRGEGWVAIQGVLLLVLVAGGAIGPQLAGAPRLVAGVAGIVLIGLGVALAAAGILRQRRQLTALPRPMDDAELADDGPYALVRHPMYGGIVLASFGWALATASAVSLVLAVAILVFFDLKSRREEAWLRERFADYAAYGERTRRLIPWVY